MYDARFGRWISPDPYGQFESPYLAMGNNPVSSIDTDGGWTLPTALIGFAAGAGIGIGIDLINDGKINDGLWWKVGIAGGLIGGASFGYESGVGVSNYGYGTSMPKRIVPSKFGRSLAGAFNSMLNALGKTSVTMLNGVIVSGGSKEGRLERPFPNLEFPKVGSPDFSKITWPSNDGVPPCPDFSGLTFSDEKIIKGQLFPRIASGADVLSLAARYTQRGGRINISSINTRHKTKLYPVENNYQVQDRLSTHYVLLRRLEVLQKQLERLGARNGSVSSRTSFNAGAGNSRVEINCD